MSTPLSVVIIEDSAIDLQMVERALLKAKVRCHIHSAVSGAAAMLLLQGGSNSAPVKTDLLLLDLGLPDIDGLELLDQARELQALENAVVIALTGSRDPGIIHMARERGVHALMNKPLSVSALLSIMAEQGFWIELSR